MIRPNRPANERRNPWLKARTVERKYERSLRGVAREIARIFAGFGVKADAIPSDNEMGLIIDHLRRYADLITPWAGSVATRMVTESDAQDLTAWRAHTAEMSRGIKAELLNAPTGVTATNLVRDNVGLIRSIPLGAAARAQALALRAVSDGTRASETAKMIAASGEVSLSRASLIARTETSRAANTLTQARAQYVGSDGYLWQTAHDSDVRPSHARMSGKYVRWDQPPTLDGLQGHAGCLPNCRCYSEPVIPEFE